MFVTKVHANHERADMQSGHIIDEEFSIVVKAIVLIAETPLLPPYF